MGGRFRGSKVQGIESSRSLASDCRSRVSGSRKGPPNAQVLICLLTSDICLLLTNP
jgi:hypothetical protein